jgi:hypothetical protein
MATHVAESLDAANSALTAPLMILNIICIVYSPPTWRPVGKARIRYEDADIHP